MMITTTIHAFNLDRKGYRKLLKSLGDIPSIGQIFTVGDNFYSLKLWRAEVEYAGMSFLLNAGVNTDNVIYYPHSNTFRFGWIKPVSEDELTEFVERIELHGNFPGALEAKMDTGNIVAVYD